MQVIQECCDTSTVNIGYNPLFSDLWSDFHLKRVSPASRLDRSRTQLVNVPALFSIPFLRKTKKKKKMLFRDNGEHVE